MTDFASKNTVTQNALPGVITLSVCVGGYIEEMPWW